MDINQSESEALELILDQVQHIYDLASELENKAYDILKDRIEKRCHEKALKASQDRLARKSLS